MPSLTIRHVTTYRCRQPVAFGEHRMMLRPRDSHDQRVIEARLEISPEPKSLRFVQDAFGNHVGIARNCKPRMPNWKGCRAKSDFAIFWRAPRSRWSFSTLSDIRSRVLLDHVQEYAERASRLSFTWNNRSKAPTLPSAMSLESYFTVWPSIWSSALTWIARVNFLYARSSAIFVAKDCRPLQ